MVLIQNKIYIKPFYFFVYKKDKTLSNNILLLINTISIHKLNLKKKKNKFHKYTYA